MNMKSFDEYLHRKNKKLDRKKIREIIKERMLLILENLKQGFRNGRERGEIKTKT